MKKYCIYFLIYLMPNITYGLIYGYKDSTGNFIFSDTSSSNSQLIHIAPVNSYASKINQQTGSKKPEVQKIIAAQKIYFIQPTQNQTFENTTHIKAVVKIEPKLTADEKLYWFLDGDLYNTSTDLTLIMNDIDRGEHHLQVRLMNADKQILAQTEPLLFYVQKTSVLVSN